MAKLWLFLISIQRNGNQNEDTSDLAGSSLLQILSAAFANGTVLTEI